MQLSNKQGGWTFLGLLAFLLVAGVFVTIGFKLAPAYSDHEMLKSIMVDTSRDQQLMKSSKTDIRLSVAKKLGINNLRDIPNEFMTITKDKGDVIFDIKYQVQIPIFANVDAVVKFEEQYVGKELE